MKWFVGNDPKGNKADDLLNALTECRMRGDDPSTAWYIDGDGEPVPIPAQKPLCDAIRLAVADVAFLCSPRLPTAFVYYLYNDSLGDNHAMLGRKWWTDLLINGVHYDGLMEAGQRFVTAAINYVQIDYRLPDHVQPAADGLWAGMFLAIVQDVVKAKVEFARSRGDQNLAHDLLILERYRIEQRCRHAMLGRK